MWIIKSKNYFFLFYLKGKVCLYACNLDADFMSSYSCLHCATFSCCAANYMVQVFGSWPIMSDIEQSIKNDKHIEHEIRGQLPKTCTMWTGVRQPKIAHHKQEKNNTKVASLLQALRQTFPSS